MKAKCDSEGVLEQLRLKATEVELAKRDEVISKKNEEISRMSEALTKMNDNISRISNTILEKDEEIVKKDQLLQRRDEELAKKEQCLYNVEQDVSRKEKHFCIVEMELRTSVEQLKDKLIKKENSLEMLLKDKVAHFVGDVLQTVEGLVATKVKSLFKDETDAAGKGEFSHFHNKQNFSPNCVLHSHIGT